MADLTDVSRALRDYAAQALYSGATSLVSADGRIYVGWPVPSQLDSDLANGNWHFSVYPLPHMGRNTTRFPKIWQTISVGTRTLTLGVSGTTVTVGGTVTAGHVCVLIVNGQPYTYTVVAGDTLNTIATSLAALITGASASGAVVTIPDAYSITARIAVQGTSGMEVRREERVFKLTAWCPTPALRDSVAQKVDALLAPIERFTLPDGFSARIIYKGTTQSDHLERQSIYRRDLEYSVEYPTTQTQTDTSIEIVELDVEDASGNPILTRSL